MQKKIQTLDSVQSVNFEFLDLLQNNGRENLLVSDASREESFHSKSVFDIATARRHRRLTNIYIKLNLFQQSKLGRNVELKNTHIVRFNFFAT